MEFLLVKLSLLKHVTSSAYSPLFTPCEVAQIIMEPKMLYAILITAGSGMGTLVLMCRLKCKRAMMSVKSNVANLLCYESTLVDNMEWT